MSSITSLLGSKSPAASLGSRLFGGSSETEDIIFGILNSKTAILNVIDRFKLMEYYKISDNNYDKVIKAFTQDINFDLTQNNFIEINVVNKSPIIAAEIANYYVHILDSLNLKINSESARSNRLFIERRYLKNLDDLRIAEDSLYNLQKRYGVVAIPEQIELAYKAAAEIEAQLFQKELFQEVLRNHYGKDSPQYQSMVAELQIIKNKIDQLKKSSEISKTSNVFLPFKELPHISISYLRIFREVEIQSKILEFILPMYEQAKVEEIKNIPTVVIIDKAEPPRLKNKPRRSLIVLGFMFLGIFVMLPLVFRMESILNKSSLRNPLEEKELKYYKTITKLYRTKYYK
jgi:tyrosine-protein kinase Etk/Wzc